MGSISSLLRATQTIGSAFDGDGGNSSDAIISPTAGFTASTSTSTASFRPRAESLDENKHRGFMAVGNDPTLEMELRGGYSTSTNLDLNTTRTSEKLPFRKRSVSCSAVYSTSTSGITSDNSVMNRRCETIMEE